MPTDQITDTITDELAETAVELPLDAAQVREDGSHEPTGEARSASVRAPAYFTWKSATTRVLGILLLIPAVPVMLPLAALVRLTSRGPMFFRQKRVGKGGREFYIYKLRTMCDDAERHTGPIVAMADDARITRVGRALRFFHWDELPQLINVARGEMDLIGPRPERPELIERIVKEVPDYCERLQVLPGVTGLAQVNLPADTDTELTRAKLALDLQYIEEAGPGLDTRIMLCSALRMVGIRYGRAVRWFRLERSTGNGAVNGSNGHASKDILSRNGNGHASPKPHKGSKSPEPEHARIRPK